MSILHAVNRRKFILSSLLGLYMPSTLAVTLPDAVKSGTFEPFSFVFVSDCHLTSRLTDNYMLLQESQLFLQDAIKQINLLKPDFVVFGGDQIQGLGDDDINWQLFLDILQSLDRPWHFILGETDVSGSMPVNKMTSFGRDWKGRGLENIEPYWSCDLSQNVHVVGLDTSQANTVTGYIDENQLNWLKADLSGKQNAITLIISHHPLLRPSADYKGNEYLLPQADRVRTILENSGGQIIAISGHTYVSKIREQKNVWYISSPGLDVYPCAFRFFKVTAEEITIDTHQIKFPALVKKAKENLLNSSLANSLGSGKSGNFVKLVLGNHVDSSAKISLAKSGKIEVHGKDLPIR
jgi:3',5'-cyclic AMP phosphodiesterase CpdA